MHTPLLVGIRKSARVNQGDLVDMDIPITGDLSTFTKKLKPGDILLSKAINPSFAKKLEAPFLGKGKWAHAGVYAGNGKMLHVYTPISGKNRGNENMPAIRKHKLSSLISGETGRDLMALRVSDLTAAQRLQAVRRAEALKKTFKAYSRGDVIRAALFPEKNKGAFRKKLDKFMCTFVPALAHKNRRLSGRSLYHMRPYDFITSKETRGVAAFDRSAVTGAG